MLNASRAQQLVFYNHPYGLSLCHGANGVPVSDGCIERSGRFQPVFGKAE